MRLILRVESGIEVDIGRRERDVNDADSGRLELSGLGEIQLCGIVETLGRISLILSVREGMTVWNSLARFLVWVCTGVDVLVGTDVDVGLIVVFLLVFGDVVSLEELLIKDEQIYQRDFVI